MQIYTLQNVKVVIGVGTVKNIAVIVKDRRVFRPMLCVNKDVLLDINRTNARKVTLFDFTIILLTEKSMEVINMFVSLQMYAKTAIITDALKIKKTLKIFFYCDILILRQSKFICNY
jgi:type IV secretory pathway TraG/TraD family ATPase VirD4